MENLLFEEFILLQLILGCCFFGVITGIWGTLSSRSELVRWGLVAFLAAAAAGIPLYFKGNEILTMLRQMNYAEKTIKSYEANHYTTLIVAFFLGIISIMSLIMQRALNRVPRLFLYPVLGYAFLIIIYLGWRTVTGL